MLRLRSTIELVMKSEFRMLKNENAFQPHWVDRAIGVARAPFGLGSWEGVKQWRPQDAEQLTRNETLPTPNMHSDVYF